MLLKRPLAIVLALAVLSALPAPAAGERASTPRERAKAVKLARGLEAEPLGGKAADARRWLALWLLEVSDLRIPFCPEVLGANHAVRDRIRSEILSQITYSALAHLIESPGRDVPPAEVYLAGILGALRAYEVVLQAQPDARSPFLDGLIAKRDAGELPAYVAETVKACPR